MGNRSRVYWIITNMLKLWWVIFVMTYIYRAIDNGIQEEGPRI